MISCEECIFILHGRCERGNTWQCHPQNFVAENQTLHQWFDPSISCDAGYMRFWRNTIASNLRSLPMSTRFCQRMKLAWEGTFGIVTNREQDTTDSRRRVSTIRQGINPLWWEDNISIYGLTEFDWYSSQVMASANVWRSTFELMETDPLCDRRIKSKSSRLVNTIGKHRSAHWHVGLVEVSIIHETWTERSLAGICNLSQLEPAQSKCQSRGSEPYEYSHVWVDGMTRLEE